MISPRSTILFGKAFRFLSIAPVKQNRGKQQSRRCATHKRRERRNLDYPVLGRIQFWTFLVDPASKNVISEPRLTAFICKNGFYLKKVEVIIIQSVSAFH